MQTYICRSICVFEKYNTFMNTYVLDFFDGNKPCPEGIKDCAALRKQYFQEIEDNKTGSQCNGCFMRIIRDKYLDLILKSK
jgi:hypothetical protein